MGVEKAITEENSSTSALLASLMKKARLQLPEKECRRIEKAFYFAGEAHADQLRKTGEPFIEHPLNVAHILLDLHLDAPSVIAGLLHDVVEDTKITLEEIKKEFGAVTANLVNGMTKLSKIRFKSDYHEESENMRKMVISMGRDVRVIVIKLADRLHNMRTLAPLSESRKLRISKETLNIYAPLAGRLGLNSIKVELEDLSFKYIYPEVYSSIFKQFEQETPQREKYIKNVIHFLTKDLSKKTKIKFKITGRTKNMYSIYRKMKLQNVDYSEVYDIIAFRICTEKVRECYEILGWVHSLWKPISERFKDFIAIPKANNYQSLHTTVIGPGGKRVEIQIRTYDMHKIAESGVAVHWKYKEESFLKNTTIQRDTFEKFSWLKDLVDLHTQSKHSNEFLESIKNNLFESEIYVFTPKGEVKEFRSGATPIDFAYAVHTDLGGRLKTAKVNGRIVPLKHQLKSGDVVEVASSSKSRPSREWLKYCVTSKARSKIRSYVNEEERRWAVQMGLKLLDKDLKKAEMTVEKFLEKTQCRKMMKNMGLNTPEDLYSQIGYGKIDSKNFIQKVLGVHLEKTLETTTAVRPVKKKKRSTSPITVEGMGHVKVCHAQCCNPLPGEDIVGYISLERGIVIHRCECDKLNKLDSERFVHVDWRPAEAGGGSHKTAIKVLLHDHPGALKQVSDVFAGQGINILNLKAQTVRGVKASLIIDIEVQDIEHLRRTVRALQKLKIVYSVSRMNTPK